MAQVAKITLTDSWQKVETLIRTATGDNTWTFDTSKTYEIECRGQNWCVLQDPTTAPTTGEDGVMLDNAGMKVVEYKKGTNDLYARALGTSSILNISVTG